MFRWLKQWTLRSPQAQARAVSQAAEETAKFMIGIHGAIGGSSQAMLNDPFVIGAIAMYSGITLKILTNGLASNSLVESAMIASVQHTFIGNISEPHDALAVLMLFKNDPEYAKGVQAAYLILGARYERKDLIYDPIIVEARAYVVSMPQSFRDEFGITEAEQVAYELTRRYIINPLKKKYADSWREAGKS